MKLIGDLTIEDVLRCIKDERVEYIIIKTPKQTIRLDQKPFGVVTAHRVLDRFMDDEVIPPYDEKQDSPV